ncbi:hypothetical protein CMU04_06195 [Elizabethkingia anophelis]|nr:hypothetical protein [Elizabethkingia anophelis]
MVIYFNKKDLIKWGNFLLSEERENSLKQTNKENENLPSYEDRKREVNNEDFLNWMEKMKK